LTVVVMHHVLGYVRNVLVHTFRTSVTMCTANVLLSMKLSFEKMTVVGMRVRRNGSSPLIHDVNIPNIMFILQASTSMTVSM
jgi:hypothetical protein